MQSLLCPLTCAIALLTAVDAEQPQAPMHWLWEIGQADNSAAEFALGPNRYRDFGNDGYFVAGWSDPANDWPYVQPGPSDSWAGGKAHTFTILFGLEAGPTEGKCRLHVDLLDTHYNGPPELQVAVNGRTFRRKVPQGSGTDGALEGNPAQGKEHRFTVTFPATQLKAGDNAITVANNTGSWVIYDWVGLEGPATIEVVRGSRPTAWIGELACPPVLVEKEGRMMQPVRLAVRRFGEATSGVLRVTGMDPMQVTLEPGQQTLEALAPAVSTDTPVTVSLEAENLPKAPREGVLRPVRHWVVYLMHHTHLDIGYTHLQSDVEAIQWRHIERALQLARETADYPAGARFKWLPEGLWAVDSYLKQATPEQRQTFFDAVKAGHIGLDALYGNELTALCRPEELIELTGLARRLSKQYGVTIDSAMITDVPGYTWGIVPVLAQSGVKYLSIGPNAGHRIGYTLSEWGDRPFYWVSPSGKEKVLCWVAGKAYSWFHRGPIREEGPMLEYLNTLQAAGFPYDRVQVRYNIGGDNGPPDPDLPDFVRDWNARYAYPKLVIATTTESFREFEERYASEIPEVRGDFTPYWEDGAASSALETALNREAAERLVQANTLWAMRHPADYPAADFQAAWREVILYDEHTWGAHNSISEPESEFALGQWAVKQAFALDADQQSRDLLARALGTAPPSADVASVRVYNTCAWRRTDVVTLPADWRTPGTGVQDAAGKILPSQRLSTGELIFLAKDVPPMGSAVFTVHAHAVQGSAGARAKGTTLANEMLSLEVDANTGAIARLECKGIPQNLVDAEGGLGLNDYFYVAGRKPDNPQRNGAVTIRVKEAGPLVASLLVESEAPGCRKLTREIRVIAGLDRVDIINTLDKEKVYEQEAVHLAFPFQVPGGVTRMDLPLAVIRAEDEQLAGSCKNYFTVQRWADVSNDEFGVTWATIDAPLIEIGAITCDPTAVGWLKEVQQPVTTLYAYVMNNYWETNYKAAQEGPTVFRFALQPHGAYDQAAAQRFGSEQSQPLLAVPETASATAAGALPVSIEPSGGLLVTQKPSDDRQAVVIRLFNGTEQSQQASVKTGGALRRSNLYEEALDPVSGPVVLAPYELVTLRAALPGARDTQ